MAWRYTLLVVGLWCNLALATSMGRIDSLPSAVRAHMMGKTWRAGCPVPLKDLAYLTMPYWGFDGRQHWGAMVVHRRVAKQVLTIFSQLYHAHFPIYEMRPIYVYHGDDAASLRANNTSGFNCRRMTGYARRWSRHSYGLAVDINPVENPYVKGKTVLPPRSMDYVKRHPPKPGMVVAGGAVHRAFQRFGWRWGGNWRRLKDYQHFEA